MAFETNTLVNGSWTTRTLDVDTVLRHFDQQDKAAIANNVEVEMAPKVGVLTQTVIQNPLVNWILRARLRTSSTQDLLAFIGDDFVQIKELRPDGLLWDLASKEDFGARIRNARVLGVPPEGPDNFDGLKAIQVKDENGDFQMSLGEDGKSSTLPPQSLLLQLDTGDSVFLTLIEGLDGKLSFLSSRYRVSKPMLKLQPGMHLSVDPSSRYMAIGCSEGIFTIYSLCERKDLEAQFSTLSSLRHVESERYIHIKGVIHKMEFLYPTEGDQQHIILLLLIIKKGRTRMIVYEWETGDDLSTIKPHSTKGHSLEQSRQMPLLLIPLKIRSAFVLVCEDSMSVCQNILERSPAFIDFNNMVPPPTAFHHGSGIPLWTAWDRPKRHLDYLGDDVYIVREDGLVMILETTPDEDDFIKSHNNIGELGTNCGPALASLDYPSRDKSGDLLVTGGDSCAGGTYLSQARKVPFFIQAIQNWSPAQDFVTTYAAQDRESLDLVSPIRANSKFLLKPDRIFASIGKGVKGAIIELRKGLEANVTLEMDYDTSITQAWVLYPSPGSIEEFKGTLFLLSMGDRSAVLQLATDASDITELSEESTSFDLRYRTLAATMHKNQIIQVTENSITLISGSYVRICEKEEIMAITLAQVPPRSGTIIADATIGENLVLFTTRVDHTVYIQAVVVENGQTDMNVDGDGIHIPVIHVHTVTELRTEVSCLAIGNIHHVPCAVIASWDGDSIVLIFQPIAGGDHKSLRVPSIYGHTVVNLEAIVSIATVSGQNENSILLCGTRNGIVLTLEIEESNLEVVNSRYDRIGASTVMVSRDEYRDSEDLFFASCDSKIYALIPKMSEAEGFIPRRWLRSLRIHPIWLTDAPNPGLQQPQINSLARLRPTITGTDGGILLASGSQLLLAGISMQPKVVPRYMSIGGTPTRLMYSSVLDILVVAASVKGRSTILFIDPDTGTDLSQPVDQKSKSPIAFVNGLGHENERIYRLFEWAYTKDGKAWNFIILSTSTGRLLILSIHQEGPEKARSDSRDKIQFYTRHKFRCTEPVYSVTGFTDGLLWCSGRKLFCDTLDLTEKRFKRVAEYNLPSPATNLFFEDGTIYALTTCHSLEILHLVYAGPNGPQIIRTHGDPIGRLTLHHIILDRISDRPIHLISDKESSLVGLWPTKDTKADTLQPIFEAQLPYSILKFRFGKCRPIWDPVWNHICDKPISTEISSTSLESIPSMMGNSETLGLSITGSLSHFTFLDFVAWKFLRFIMDMAIRSPKICEFTCKGDSVPLEEVMEPIIMMHIDGDILKRCLEERRLEELLGYTEVGLQNLQGSLLQSRFTELLRQLHRDKLEKRAPSHATTRFYIDQAYADLEFFLRPVM